ncbi:NAD(P)H-binding protein [Polaribacter sp. Asnod1-A03]|uniref:NAD(P)H-binding protein n=1 Tax=Polaribacter sp. Asnod1-A03 TaxID=3160581 RepID=UPI00386883F5
MKALIIGATGSTGKELLDLILKDNYFDKVEIFVRRNISISNDKLKVNVIDFDKTDQWKNLVKGDVLFSCLGTTLKAAGSKDAQWKIDYQYQYDFAKEAKQNQVKNYVLISSAFASADSSFFYSKMKGQLDDDIKKLDFENTIIFKPPILERKDSKRTTEIWTVKAIKFFNKFGILKKNKPISTEVLAQSMINALKKLKSGTHILEQQEILEY